MEQLAADYVDKTHFLFIYVREAHPGENYLPHQYFEQKMLHARALRDLGLRRTILVDSLYGRVHRLYGGVSNMSWIVDHTGHVSYRASWTVAPDVRAALEETLRTRDLRREGKHVTTYYCEIMGLKPVRDEGDSEQRFLGGKVAEEQFQRAQARPHQRADAPG